jgi:hypothetical protein
VTSGGRFVAEAEDAEDTVAGLVSGDGAFVVWAREEALKRALRMSAQQMGRFGRAWGFMDGNVGLVMPVSGIVAPRKRLSSLFHDCFSVPAYFCLTNRVT